jgi:hypothetical protein
MGNSTKLVKPCCQYLIASVRSGSRELDIVGVVISINVNPSLIAPHLWASLDEIVDVQHD